MPGEAITSLKALMIQANHNYSNGHFIGKYGRIHSMKLALQPNTGDYEIIAPVGFICAVLVSCLIVIETSPGSISDWSGSHYLLLFCLCLYNICLATSLGIAWGEYPHKAFGGISSRIQKQLLPLSFPVIIIGTISLIPLSWLRDPLSKSTVVNYHPTELVLLAIMCGILPFHMPLQRCFKLLIPAHLLLTGLAYLNWHPHKLLIFSMVWFVFSLYLLMTTNLAIKESRGRKEIEFVNQQLAATQQLLAESSKQDERLRISRDLHDVIGHHLTGLSLRLEAASHITEGDAKEDVTEAKLIAKMLLSDVRQVVSDMRQPSTLDLRRALGQLAQDMNQPRLELEMPEHIDIADNHIAETIFRAVQEILTNCRRHSRAQHLKIRMRGDEKFWYISTEDNIDAPVLLELGNGLTGLRERIEQLGGKLDIDAHAGITHNITIPKKP